MQSGPEEGPNSSPGKTKVCRARVRGDKGSVQWAKGGLYRTLLTRQLLDSRRVEDSGMEWE